jgi:hypothetical protein
MMDKIQPYRQPMVTATGIFLGFMLNYTSEWLQRTNSIGNLREIVVAIAIVVSLSLLLLTLFRILRMNYSEYPDKFYRRTLFYFLIGIGVPFMSFTVIIIQKFIAGNS